MDYAIVVTDNSGAPLVSVKTDGTIEYGPNYKPDLAARTFWTAMSNNFPPLRLVGSSQILVQVLMTPDNLQIAKDWRECLNRALNCWELHPTHLRNTYNQLGAWIEAQETQLKVDIATHAPEESAGV
jgi:hypothetical protein